MKLLFDVYKLSKRLVAWFLRKTLMLEWLQVLTKPIKQMNEDLDAFRQEVIRLHHKNYETVAFQSYLNDEFDGSSDTSRKGFPTGDQRRIKVINQQSYNRLMSMFLIDESQPLTATYLIDEVDNNANLSMSDLPDTYLLSEQFEGADFIVEVPAGVYNSEQLEEIRLTLEDIKIDQADFTINEV